MNGIPFLLDERAHRMGLEKWVSLDYSKSCHVLWAGRSGSGKSVAAKLLLARTVLLAPPELQPVELTIIDPKEDIDFGFLALSSCSRFYRGEEAPQGLNDFYDAYIKRKNGSEESESVNLKICFVDEFASMINILDSKKEKEEAQRKLNLLLTLSRSRRFSVQLATQQPSAQIFGTSGSASREQFGAVCLLGDGGGGSETQSMLFDGVSRERMREFGSIGGRAAGWLSINGGIAQPVRVPTIGDMDKLNKVIYDNLA